MCGVWRRRIWAAVALMETFLKADHAAQPVAPSSSFWATPNFATRRCAPQLAGWVDKKPPPLFPDVRVTQVSALIITSLE